VSRTRATQDRTLRIIGGNWRSRKVSFPDRESIRPTPDRVRETLFNWLQGDVYGSRCLELYAGSGVLGIEALSRGARHVTFVDQDAGITRAIRQNLATLGATPASFDCVTAAAAQWLQTSAVEPFDIVFLDPPFDSTEWHHLLPVLAHHLSPEARVYIETPAALDPSMLPPALRIHRQKHAGQVHFALCLTVR